MEGFTIDKEREERFLFEKKNIRCESVRRSVEVLSHAIQSTSCIANKDLTEKLVKSLEGKLELLDTTLAEIK